MNAPADRRKTVPLNWLLDFERFDKNQTAKPQRIAMQYPSEIPGITNAEFLRAAMNAGKEDDEKISVREFITKLDEKMELLNMKEEMAERYLNEGFSGGEKKRNEIL